MKNVEYCREAVGKNLQAVDVRGKREEVGKAASGRRQQQSYLTLLTCKNSEKSSRIRVGIRLRRSIIGSFSRLLLKPLHLPNGVVCRNTSLYSEYNV